jgi:hypothetical protein
MVPLSHPTLRPEVSADQIKKYSQRQVDVLNLRKGVLETVDFRTLSDTAAHPDLFYAVSVQQDDHLAPPLFKTQPLEGQELCLTFENLLAKTEFVAVARKALATIEAAYGRPVDVEFAWDGQQFYLLQCRSLSMRKELAAVSIPKDVPTDRVLFTTQSGLSNSVVPDLEYIVYVNPRAYDALPSYEAKLRIAAVVNLLNRQLADKRYALMGPGRWGSNDINLGVRVTYSNINKTKLLVEIAFAREGYTPEVSYGTHFFQDLVEADIITAPLFPDDPGAYFDEEFVTTAPNLLAEIAPEAAECAPVIRVIHVPSARRGDYLHVYMDTVSQKGLGCFGPRQGLANGGAATPDVTI